MSLKCIIFHCDNTISSKARLKTCHQCRRCFHYWEQPGKGVGAVIRRQAQLERWQDRMRYLADEKPRFRRVGTRLPPVARPVGRPRLTQERIHA